MSAVAKQPSVFHPSSVLSSTPLRARKSELQQSDLAEYESPIKGHKIRSRNRTTGLATLEEASSIGYESSLQTSQHVGAMKKASPLANLGEVMRTKFDGRGHVNNATPSRRIVHSPPNTQYASPVKSSRPKSPVVRERAPTLTNALTNMNLSAFLEKSPILREKFMRIQRERDTSPVKVPDGQWLVQSPDKLPDPEYRADFKSLGSRYDKKQELKFGEEVVVQNRQGSPVRYRNEIDTSDLSEVSPTKRRRMDSPERRRQRRQEKEMPKTSFRPITPPNQYAKVTFASPERQIRNPSPRKISPIKRPTKSSATVLPSAPVKLTSEGKVTSSAKKTTSSRNENANAVSSDARRPKLMDRSGELYSMGMVPKSPAQERRGTQPKKSAHVPDIVKKAMQSPEEFLLSLARSTARAPVQAAGGEEVNSESSQRSAGSSQRSGALSQRSAQDALRSTGGSQRGGRDALRSTGGSQRSDSRDALRSTGGSQRGDSRETLRNTGSSHRNENPLRSTTSSQRSLASGSQSGARPKTTSSRGVQKKTGIDTKRFAEALAGNISTQRRDHDSRSQDSSQKSDASKSTASSHNMKPASAFARVDSYGGARPKTGPSLEKWKRPTHMKPQATTPRNLNRVMDSLQSEARKSNLVQDFYHHLENLNREDETTIDPTDGPTCLGLTGHEGSLDTLDDISSIASLRSIEAESVPLIQPVPNDVRIADTSSTAWTKTSPSDEIMDTSSTRRLVEQIQEPKVRKTYRNISPTKKFPTPFLPIEPAAASNREMDESVVVPNVITKIVVDERKSPRKEKTSKSPVKRVTSTMESRQQTKRQGSSEADTSTASSSVSPRKKPSPKDKTKASSAKSERPGSSKTRLEVRGTSATVRKPNESFNSPVKRNTASAKEKKREPEAQLISSLKSTLKSEIDNLLRNRKSGKTEDLQRVLKLAHAIERKSTELRTKRTTPAEDRRRDEGGRGEERDAEGAVGGEDPPTPLRRAGTYEVVNESVWGEEDLDVVPIPERSIHETASPNKRVESRATTGSRTAASEVWASARSELVDISSEHLLRSENYETPRSARSQNTDMRGAMCELDIIREARIRALDRPLRQQEIDTRSLASEPARSPSTNSEVTQRSARSEVLRNVAIANLNLPPRGGISTLPTSLEPKVSNLKPASPLKKSKSQTLAVKSETPSKKKKDDHFESQKLDLKASLKGVKEKLENLRADLQMTPKLDYLDENPPSSSRSVRSETSRATDRLKSEASDRESTPRSLVSMETRSLKETPRSESMASASMTSAKSTPSLTASQRLGEIEEDLRRRQMEKDRQVVLTLHEHQITLLAAQCQKEMKMIKMVRNGEMSYERYGRQMVDILAEKLENLHVLKNKVLSIPNS